MALLITPAIFCRAETESNPPATAKEIRLLSKEAAAAALPVQIEGVVTWRSAASFYGFLLHDGTEAVYVDVREAERRQLMSLEQTRALNDALKPGSKVRVQAITDPGAYAPCLVPREATVTGTGVIPAAEPAYMMQLISGKLEGQRVVIDGVVRKIKDGAEAGTREITVGRSEGEFQVIVVQAAGLEAETLIDALVNVTGVSLPVFNSRAEITGVSLQANDAADIEVKKPSRSPEPFQARLVPLNELRTFQRRYLELNRCRVRGVVTACVGRDRLFIQDGSHGLKIEGDPGDLRPGDVIEASGFIGLGNPISTLVHALIRKTGTSEMPAPQPTDVRQLLLSAQHDAVRQSGSLKDMDHTLVSVTGELIQVEHLEGEMRLTFLNSGSYSRAFLPGRGYEKALPDFRPGCTARFTGVASLNYSATHPSANGVRASSVRFDLRTADDITVLAAAPWWTAQRVSTLLWAGFALLAVMLAWVLTLRRQVALQSGEMYLQKRQLRDEALRLEAVHRERNRLGGEIHDGVQQLMHTLRLEAETAAKCLPTLPLAGAHHVANIRHGIDHALQEMRLCLLGLAQVTADDLPLDEMLRRAMEVFGKRPAGTFEVTTCGTPRLLPSHVRASLCLLAQEAVGNALRHGKAAHVTLRIDWTEGLELTIQDDGHGFDASRVMEDEHLHFGLTGMSARMRRLGGEAIIESKPGQGTRITARLSGAALDFETRTLLRPNHSTESLA